VCEDIQVLQLAESPSHYRPQPTVRYMADALSFSMGSLAHKRKPELQTLGEMVVTGDRLSPQMIASRLVLPSRLHRSGEQVSSKQT